MNVACRQNNKGVTAPVRAKAKWPKGAFKVRVESAKCRYHAIPHEVCGCLC
jgi:hypothetical protein